MFISSIRLTNPDFIVPTIEDGRITLNCAKEDVLCNNYVLKNADYKVFLSATVGSKDAFDDNCGIKLNKNDSVIKRVDSTFDFSRSPIVFINRYKMNYNSIDENFEKVAEMCMQIMKKYQNERGIIHTGSYANTVKLEEILKKSEFANRIITYENSLDKTFAVNRLNELKNGILVGPTLMEGIDLPDDLCRFNIIMKVPYPNTSDKLVRAKMNIFPTWYNSETSMNIIQSIGRGVRNEKDWCHTYILDACFDFLYKQTSGQYPNYVKKRIKLLK
jgi:Rad3-related DNA helicase